MLALVGAGATATAGSVRDEQVGKRMQASSEHLSQSGAAAAAVHFTPAAAALSPTRDESSDPKVICPRIMDLMPSGRAIHVPFN